MLISKREEYLFDKNWTGWRLKYKKPIPIQRYSNGDILFFDEEKPRILWIMQPDGNIICKANQGNFKDY